MRLVSLYILCVIKHAVYILTEACGSKHQYGLLKWVWSTHSISRPPSEKSRMTPCMWIASLCPQQYYVSWPVLPTDFINETKSCGFSCPLTNLHVHFLEDRRAGDFRRIEYVLQFSVEWTAWFFSRLQGTLLHLCISTQTKDQCKM